MSGPWDDYAGAAPVAPATAEQGPWSDYNGGPPALHTWQLTGRDGKVIQYTAPENADDATIQAAAARAAGVDPAHISVNRAGPSAIPPQDHSAANGFVGGLIKPLDNLAGWVDAIPGVHEAGDFLAHATGLPTTSEANAQHDAFRANNDRTGYQTVGGIVGTLPTAAMPGGLFAQGAASGALLSNGDKSGSIGLDALEGGVAGAVGGRVLGGIAGAVAPRISPHVQLLMQNGVRPTLGQVARVGQGLASRIISNVEDRATALPIAGDTIGAARDATATQFRRGAVQQALTPIGVELPGHLETGHGMVAFAQRQISRAYDAALSQMRMVPDGQLATDLAGLDARVRGGALSPQFQRRLATEVHGNVARRIYGNGTNGLNGQELQTTLSSLRQKAQRFGASQDAEQQEYGDVLGELADHIENAAARSSAPEAVAARNAANTSYAHLTRVEGAAKSAIEGDFSPGQLDVAVRQGATRVRGRDASAGQALMQDYSTAARRVLPSQTGSSGTAERLNTANPFKWALGASLAPGAALANRSVPFLTRTAGPRAQTAADMLRLLSPAGGAIAAPLSVQLTQP